MLIPSLLGSGWWKTTSDMLDEQGLGAGYKDGFGSSRAGQRKTDEQDAATKLNPECGSLDIADFCALVDAGLGMNVFVWYFGCLFLQTHLCSVNVLWLQ